MFSLIDHQLFRLIALCAGLFLALPWELQGLMMHGITLMLAALLIALGLMPRVISLAHKLGALDIPDGGRRLHRQITPRIGGVAVILAANITLFLNFNFSLAFKGVVISGLMVASVSFWDDVKEISASMKLMAQCLAVSVLIACGVHVDVAPDVWWGEGLEYIITALWVIGITNAFNFLDGINGLAAALATVTCFLMGLLAWHTDQVLMFFLCFAIAGSAAGFLPDNARYETPARTFLGDVGSTYLGWVMAAIAVMGDWSSEGAIKAYAAPLLIFSVMIFDIIHTTVARIARGDVHNFHEWIAYVGRDHLHHRLMGLGCSQKQAVLLIVALSCLMGLTALALINAPLISVVLLLSQACLFYGILTFLMGRAKAHDEEHS
ncbi:MAG: MraY family glycosyltransferase [Mariprofundaceae bacterium]|nr:MraY family glycosyltransferase [Mariprofundaceae bacterium]